RLDSLRRPVRLARRGPAPSDLLPDPLEPGPDGAAHGDGPAQAERDQPAVPDAHHRRQRRPGLPHPPVGRPAGAGDLHRGAQAPAAQLPGAAEAMLAGGVSRLDRRDYFDRWGQLLAEAEEDLKSAQDTFK